MGADEAPPDWGAAGGGCGSEGRGTEGAGEDSVLVEA